MGISDLIRHRRIKLAERYLRENDYSVSRIAELVGIRSASYLIRAFKDEVGITPLKYREKMRICK
jgi:AraC-like DNA-binding protein